MLRAKWIGPCRRADDQCRRHIRPSAFPAIGRGRLITGVISAESSKRLEAENRIEICRTRPTLSHAIQAVDNNTRLTEGVKRWTFEGDVPVFFSDFCNVIVFGYCNTEYNSYGSTL